MCLGGPGSDMSFLSRLLFGEGKPLDEDGFDSINEIAHPDEP
jgi:hypothetical protein